MIGALSMTLTVHVNVMVRFNEIEIWGRETPRKGGRVDREKSRMFKRVQRRCNYFV